MTAMRCRKSFSNMALEPIPMSEKEQQAAFEKELDRLCDRFAQEFDLDIDDMIPSLQLKCLMLLNELQER